MKRLFGEVSEDHEQNFMLIKGALGAKTNGEVLEALIDRVTPTIKREIASKKGVKR